MIVDPLIDSSPAEVPLANAPLVRVIAQVRFPEILSVEQRSFVAPFQEALRDAYPVLRQEQTQDILLGPTGVQQAKGPTAWRFADLEGQWRVSLTPFFLALETTKYTSRTDFFARLRIVAEALAQHLSPKVIDRLGVRYISRITGADMDDVASLIEPVVRGLNGSPAAAHATLSVSESLFDLPGARVHTRWGCLPPNATVDPSALEPVPFKSWILDFDMFSIGQKAFDVDELVSDGRSFAARLYTIFRWAVTDQFLVRYGGNP